MPVLSGAGVGKESDHASSTTLSAVSDGIIQISDEEKQQFIGGVDSRTVVSTLNRDVVINEMGDAVNSQGSSAAEGLEKIFDAENVARKLKIQVEITKAFNQEAPKALATYAKNKTQPYQDAKDYKYIKEFERNGGRLSEYQLRLISKLEKSGMTREKAQDILDSPEMKNNYSNWNNNGNYRRAANIILAAIGGGGDGMTIAVARESLSWAADKMRDAMIEDSKKFPGICDDKGNCVNNMSGSSVGLNGDNNKVAGGRIVLDKWCEVGGNGACERDSFTKSGYKENEDGTVIFKPKDNDGNPISIMDFMKNHQELRSPLGGVQGGVGMMNVFGVSYDYYSGSYWDILTESFAGTHDSLNGFIWYDNLGNGKLLDGKFIGKIGDFMNIANVALSSPFSLSVLLPPEVWMAVSGALK